jgi:hypothetical protein
MPPALKFYRFTRTRKPLPASLDEDMFEASDTIHLLARGKKVSAFYTAQVVDEQVSIVEEVEIDAVPPGARAISREVFEEHAIDLD